MIGASQVNGLLVGRIDSGKLLMGAICLSVTGGILLVAVSLWSAWYAPPAWQPYEVWLVIAAMLLALAPTGIIFPNAMMGALADHPSLAGAASALAGTLQYVLGAVAGVVVGQFPAVSAIPMAGCMCCGAILMFLMGLLRPNRQNVN